MLSSKTFNMDCMEYMKDLPDKYFDLAVVDPPYGDGLHAEDGGGKGWFAKYNQSFSNSIYQKSQDDGSQVVQVERERERRPEYNRFGNPGSRFEKYKRFPDGQDAGGEARKKIIAWDTAPEREYFDQLFRVSRNQIIWGGNYFELPPTRCFLVWRKLTISENFTMAMAEYAWTSFNDNAKVFEFAPQGKKGDTRFHPTQKPIELYEWVFRLFAKQGDKILDTHLGSGSSRIAAYEAGFDFVGCEIDPVYYELEEQRFEKFVSQRSIFDADYGAAEQTGLWEDL